MTRILRLFLLTMALVGLVGQSTAMAMGPAVAMSSAEASMAGTDCMDMATGAMPDGTPCKKMTWQCIAAMGCATPAAIAPTAPLAAMGPASRVLHGPVVVAALSGRSYGPEPDPPSFLI
ncbi:MAG: hypothetical protein WC729_08690 [Sphingomonas sp.]|uniref:hypothetical protein n=1 Tax=Sphingomonas sp. TaxID=28214 RepID=UPI00356AF1E0